MLSQPTSIIATSNSGIFGAGLAIIMVLAVVAFIVAIFYIYCNAKIFQKAGKPAWAAIVPIYNYWVYLEIGGKPGWLSLILLLSFIPFVGILVGLAYFVISILVNLEIAKRFGKSTAFAIFLLVILPFIGLPMLAFGKAQYNSPLGDGPLPNTPPQGPAPIQPSVPGMGTPTVGGPVTPGVVTSSQPITPPADTQPPIMPPQPPVPPSPIQ